MENINVNAVLNKFSAENREYLIETIQFASLVNANCSFNSTETFENWCIEIIKEKEAEEAKERIKAEKALSKEIAKAKEKNLTLEEFREYEKKRKKAMRYESEIRKYEKEIERLTKEIEWRKRKVKEIKEEL